MPPVWGGAVIRLLKCYLFKYKDLSTQFYLKVLLVKVKNAKTKGWFERLSFI